MYILFISIALAACIAFIGIKDVASKKHKEINNLEYRLNEAEKEKLNLLADAKMQNSKLKEELAISEKNCTFLTEQLNEANERNDNLVLLCQDSILNLLNAQKESLSQNTDIDYLFNFINRSYSLGVQSNAIDQAILENALSNLKIIPYMARIMADYETYGLDILASQLNWGNSQERKKKVKSLITLKKETKEMLEKYKTSEYQLTYLLELYPALQDVIDCEFNQLPITDFTKITDDYDKTRDFLSKEEYQALSTTERNQLALDRYKNSKNKTKWQIGRDYELYVGYKYSLKGYSIDYTGSYLKLEDLGRDLIAKKDDTTLIIQCKYWSTAKLIHEKHITQLYGTTICYCIEHDLPTEKVKGVLVTNITLSDTAKKMADYLNIQYAENFKKHDFPCIKCNIGHDEFGNMTKIYHLPFDQQYDITKIDSPGEFYAMTVQEAENAGFRRAFKWHVQ